jgi:hypothetical protein
MKITINNIIPFEVWQKKVKDRKYLRPVFLLDDYLKKNISDELVGFYLHGSLASLDYVPGYSDLDAIAIIRKEKRLSKKKMKQINKFPFLIDLLQHHPVSILEEKEMENYTRADLPVSLFEKAVALGRSRLQLTFDVKDFGARKLLEEFSQQFENWDFKNYQPKSALELKFFLSMVQLLPALYLQAKTKKWGKKKDSFQRAKGDFDREWEIIEKATQARSIWRYSPIFSPRVQDFLLRIPNLERLVWLYGKFLMPIPQEIKKIMDSQMVKEAHNLTQAMIRKINEK